MAKNMVLTYLHFRILKFPLMLTKTGGYNIIIYHLWLMVGLKQKSLVGLNHHDLYLRTEPISLGQLHGLHYRNDFTGHLSLAAQKNRRAERRKRRCPCGFFFELFPCIDIQYHGNLVGGAITILKNMSSSMGWGLSHI